MVGHVLQDLLASLFRSVPQLHRDVADCFEGSMSGYFREVTANIAMNSFSLHCTNPALNGISKAVPELSEGCCTRPWMVPAAEAGRAAAPAALCLQQGACPCGTASVLAFPEPRRGAGKHRSARPRGPEHRAGGLQHCTAPWGAALAVRSGEIPGTPQTTQATPGMGAIIPSTADPWAAQLLQEKLWRLFNRSQQNDSIPISSQTG